MAIYEAIKTTYLEANAANVEWTSIPSTYENLSISISARTTGTSQKSIELQLGTGGGAVDTGLNYSTNVMYFIATTAYGSNTAADTKMMFYYFLPATNSVSEAYGTATIDLYDYANTNKNTQIGSCEGKSGAYAQRVGMTMGTWNNTGAVDRIKLTGQTDDFARGSVFTLYGVNSS
jgi:hypothetical protein